MQVSRRLLQPPNPSHPADRISNQRPPNRERRLATHSPRTTSSRAIRVFCRPFTEPITSITSRAIAARSSTAMGTPQLLSRKTNGVTGGQSSSDAPKAPRVKAPPQGEKVVVRRLPPAMTEEEFVTILGDEWRVGRAKVDWFSYWPGKVSQQSVIPFRAPAHREC